ncbi:MAG TPA: SCO family protein [Gaiellaceae bacterium]|nr:SCO family protein [Gaiellaceae bacterium]
MTEEAAAGSGRSSSLRLLCGAAAIAAAIGVGAGVAIHLAARSSAARAAPRLPALEGQAVWPAGRRPAPNFVLVDQRGRHVSLRSSRGRTVVLAFMDSLCHQVCPLEGRTLAQAMAAVPRAARPTLLVVSVDPWGDTPASARAAAAKWRLAGNWHWLLGSRRELAPVWRAYRIYVRRTSGDIIHSDAVYVVDRNGFERAGYLYPFLPGPVAHDLRVLARPGSA